MNALARQLNMTRTRFLNPTGLDTVERPYSTAFDMARLTRHALTKPDFNFFIASKERRVTIHRAGVTSDYMLRNTNDLLGVHNIDGVKTGQTARAGGCLIISAARDPVVLREVESGPPTLLKRRIIVVLLGSPDRFPEAKQLLERGGSALRRLGQGRAAARSQDLALRQWEVGGRSSAGTTRPDISDGGKRFASRRFAFTFLSALPTSHLPPPTLYD